MQVQITKVSKSEATSFVSATCGKVEASVCFSRFGVQVCCHNAANRAWRGLGRSFATAADALAAYRSAEMRAIIEAAVAAVRS